MTQIHASTFDRHAVTQRHAGLDFSLLLPLGWRLDVPVQAAAPAPTAWVELARARSASALGTEPARVVVSGCARTDAPSLQDALGTLLRRHDPATAAELRPLQLGRHAGLAATLQARHRGQLLTLRVAMLEDGGRLLRLVLSAPPGHEALGLRTWSTLAGGLVLDELQGATLPRHPTPVGPWDLAPPPAWRLGQRAGRVETFETGAAAC